MSAAKKSVMAFWGQVRRSLELNICAFSLGCWGSMCLA